MANAVSGYVNAYRGRHKASVNAGLKALQLNPSFAMGYHAIGLAYVFNGQHSEGIDAIKEAMRLSPFDHMMPMWLATLSAAYYLSQDYEIALEAAEAAIEKAPKYALALRAKPSALAKLGRLDEARDALKEFLAVSPNYTVARGRSVLSFRNEADFEHYMDGLRMAGLPEE
jgi:tetratricopeptide (TPR) repeat protein